MSCGSCATHKNKPVCLHKYTRWSVGSRVHTLMHTGVCAQVHRGSCAGMCRLGPGSSLALSACLAHLPRVPGARWGRVAQKPLPAAVPSFREATRWHPAHRACLPLHQEGPRRPSPQPLHTDPHNAGDVQPTSSPPSEPLTVRTRGEPSRAESAGGVKACAPDPWRGSGAHVGLCTQWDSAGTGALHSKHLNLGSVCTILMTTGVHVRVQVYTH